MENNEFLSVFNETGYPNLAFKELTGIEHAIINIALGSLGRDPCIAIDMLMRRYNDGGANSSDLAHYTYEACPQHGSREDGFFVSLFAIKSTSIRPRKTGSQLRQTAQRPSSLMYLSRTWRPL